MRRKSMEKMLEEVQWLRDDIVSCRNAMRRPGVSIPERVEYRLRISRNHQRLARLKQEMEERK